MWWWGVALASAAVPEGVTPVLAPLDAPAQFDDYRRSQGLSADALACDAFWAGEALLCFKVDESGKRRWVTASDLQKWHTDLATVRSAVVDRARAALKDEPKPTTVDGMPGVTYFQAAEGDGWAAAGVLQPDLLVAKVGAPIILVATPIDGVLLAWAPGNPDLDKILAVGAAQMYDQKDGPVTPMIHQWDGTAWSDWGEAKPTVPAP